MAVDQHTNRRALFKALPLLGAAFAAPLLPEIHNRAHQGQHTCRFDGDGIYLLMQTYEVCEVVRTDEISPNRQRVYRVTEQANGRVTWLDETVLFSYLRQKLDFAEAA